MVMREGTGRLGLWPVSAAWDENYIHRVWFMRLDKAGSLHPLITEYLAGRITDLSMLRSPGEEGETLSARIYQVVREIPYGETRTYTEVAQEAGTHPRVVGGTLRRNPTPLVIPCHRVVAQKGIGGFTPDISIKTELLALESRTKKKDRLKSERGI